MFNIYQSFSLNTLARALGEILAEKKGDPFRQTSVILQNNELKEWLSLRIADQQGIAAHLSYTFPSEFIWKTYRTLHPEVPSSLPSDLNAMQWGLFGLLRKDHALLQQIPFDLGDAPADSVLFQLCRQLADNFDQYQVYRPEMMEDWLKQKLVTGHKDEKWQAFLWKKLNDYWKEKGYGSDFPRRSEAFIELTKALRSKPVTEWEDRLPDELFIFGLSHLPRPLIDLLGTLSRHCTIHYFDRKSQLPESESQFSELYAEWGKPESEQADYLKSILDEYGVQFQIHQLPESRNYRTPSIRLHSCHSRRREVEVLKDALLKYLDNHHKSNLSDCLVMVPEPDAYAGTLERVFESEEYGKSIPITRLYSRREQSESYALQYLVTMLDSSFKASSVLEFLTLNPVQKQLSITDADLTTLEQWVLDNRIHHSLGENIDSAYSWHKGLNQLLTGFLMEAEFMESFGGLIPYAHVSSMEEADLSARLSRYVHFLQEAEQEMKNSRSPIEWMELIQKWVHQFISGESEKPSLSTPLHRHLNKIEDQLVYTQGEAPVAFELFKRWFLGQLDSQSSQSGRFGQGVTVSSYVPYRSIPFDFIAVLGMNEGVFPRKAVRPDFDLIHAEPKPGDRTLKEDDTYLFLETLQATGMHLHLSYMGQDQHSDAIKLPSILVQQLMDLSGWDNQKQFIKHSLHPFNKKYFEGPSEGSYSTHNRSLAEYFYSQKTHPDPAFVKKTLAGSFGLDENRISLQDFLSFFKSPCQYYAQKVLDIRNYEGLNEIEDREAFKLSGLPRHILDNLIFEATEKGISADQLQNYAMQAHLIPQGLQGEKAFAKEKQGIDSLMEAISQQTTGTPDKQRIDVKILDRFLEGEISGLYEDTLVGYRVGKRKAVHEIEHWLKHLLLLRAGYKLRESIFLSKDKEEIQILRITSENINEGHLDRLMKWYKQGDRSKDKLAFFAESSRAFARTFHDKGDREAALKKARSEWEPSRYLYSPESENFYHQLIWRGLDPLSSTAFEECSLLFWIPFLENSLEEKR